MNKRWYIYVLALALAITGLVVLSPTRIAQAAGGDGGAVSVYVYHDVNEDGIWNWGHVAPPNLRGDHPWRWDFPCLHPASVCETAEIGLVGAEVALDFYGSATRVEKTFHDGPAQFWVPLGTQVVGVRFLGAGDGRHWRVTNVSQKTVNEPAASQFAFNFPLPPTGPNSMHVILIGVAEVAHVAPPCSSTQAQATTTTAVATTAATTAAAYPSATSCKSRADAEVVGAVSVYVYHDVNRDGIWNWGHVVPPNLRGDYAWRWDFPCLYPASVCETAEIGLVGAEVALRYYGSETRVGKTFHDGPAEFGIPLGTQVVGVQFLGAGDGRHWQVTNVSQKTVNEPAASQFAFNFPLPPTGPNSMHVILIGVAEVDPPCETPGPTTYTIQPGDTLTSIAHAFGTTVEALASANCIANPNLIYAGAVITIP